MIEKYVDTRRTLKHAVKVLSTFSTREVNEGRREGGEKRGGREGSRVVTRSKQGKKEGNGKGEGKNGGDGRKGKMGCEMRGESIQRVSKKPSLPLLSKRSEAKKTNTTEVPSSQK